MKTSDIVKNMPLLADLRPDFLLEKIEETLLLAGKRMAEVGQFLEREYCVPLQCGVSEYGLDEPDETIHTIKSLCIASSCEATSECSAEAKAIIVADGWCGSRSCGAMRFRYIPHNIIEIDKPKAARGCLVITATVAPKYDTCELDDLFTSKYRSALMYSTGQLLLEYPGDGQSLVLARTYAQRAEDELTRLWVRRAAGHTNRAPVVRSARFV